MNPSTEWGTPGFVFLERSVDDLLGEQKPDIQRRGNQRMPKVAVSGEHGILIPSVKRQLFEKGVQVIQGVLARGG